MAVWFVINGLLSQGLQEGRGLLILRGVLVYNECDGVSGGDNAVVSCYVVDYDKSQPGCWSALFRPFGLV